MQEPTQLEVRPDLVPRASCPGWLRAIPLAHRGLHAGPDLPENSLAAFAAAAATGYGVELDVMLSRDRVPVVCHDLTLERVTGQALAVQDLTVAELAGLRLGTSDEHIPTLAAALAELTAVPVMVELKQPRLRVGTLEAAVATLLDRHPGPWCVASFNPGSLRWYRRRRPDAVRVLTAGGIEDAPLPAALKRRLSELRDVADVAPHAISYALADLPVEAASLWRARGGTLLTWTVTDEQGLARSREMADNVIFEHVRP
ncbi:MAG: glycerophosphodiester phosphodiesterase family protein [Nitriliruptoraceae bacterium]